MRPARRLCIHVALASMPRAIACAQVGDAGQVVSVSGDTRTPLPSCKAADAVTAINHWFRAVETGDTLRIARGVSRKFHWISVYGFSESERFTGRTWSDLHAYVQRRAAARERLTLRSIQFNGWRNDALNFGPIYFERGADDLGPGPRRGFGKGAYACGEGLIVLSVGPAP